MSRTVIGSVLAVLGVTGCVLLPIQEAPEACGFPDGTSLSHAGRSTTAALGVEEVEGDPMSDHPADIYITRDALDQGELRGRLVCAIFVDQPGFMEITVHPADVEPVANEPEPALEAPPDGISMEDAVVAARDAVPEPDTWEVVVTEGGPIESTLPGGREGHDWASDLPADLGVWRVFLVRGDEGADVIVDFVDGSVYGVAKYIVN